MSSSTQGKILLVTEVDTREAQAAFEKIKSDAGVMGGAVAAASGQASTSLDGINKAADDAAQSLTKVGGNARTMASDVAGAGAKAGGALGGVGQGGDQAAAKVDAATRSMIGSIERATAAALAGERGTAKYFETLASQRGISKDQIKPYIDNLRATEAAQNNVGASAGQMQQAMRQLPMQFTDIFTSLAAGQPPMMVMLQQGGQLKDTFGGIGPAAQAMGGYVMGLVNPITLAAAAIGTIVVAAYQGSTELSGLQRALIGTGYGLGVTAHELSAMASGIAATGVATHSRAIDLLKTMVEQGDISAAVMQRAAQAALAFEAAGGQAAETTTAHFAKLAQEPMKAAVKLNEATNFLTLSQLNQIHALELQGKKADAAAVASEAYAAVLAKRAPEMREQLNWISAGWMEVSKSVKQAWDDLTSNFRDQTLDEQITSVEARIERLRRTLAGKQAVAASDSTDSMRAGGMENLIKLEEKHLQNLRATAALSEQKAKADGEGQKQVNLRAEYLSTAERYLTKELRDKKDLIKREQELAFWLGKKAISQNEYNESLAQAREFYKPEVKKAPQSTANPFSAEQDAAREWAADYLQLAEAIRAAQAELSGLSKVEADIAKIRSSAGYTGASPEARKLQDDQMLALRLLEIEREVKKAKEDAVRVAEAGATSAEARLQALRDEAKAADMAASGNMVLAQAIEEVAIERLREAHSKSLADGDMGRVMALEREIEARRELGKLAGADALRKEAKSLAKDLEDSLGKSFGANLAAGFDEASKSLGTFVQTFADLMKSQDLGAEEHKKLLKLRETDLGEYLRKAKQAEDVHVQRQLNGWGNMVGAAKGFFKEGTRGYEGLQRAEQVFRAFEFAMSVKAVAQKMFEVTAPVAVKVAADQTMAASGVSAAAVEGAANLAKGATAAVAGVANQASGDPYSAFPRMAAMAAIMAGLGFIVGGLGAGGGGARDPGNTGTGTVLGDGSAKSKSINSSIERLAANSDIGLAYSAGMLASLRAIEQGIGGLSGLVVRDSSLTTGANFGIDESARLPSWISNPALGTALGGVYGLAISLASKIPVVGQLLGSLFGTKLNVQGTGLYMGNQAFGDVERNGANLQTYADVRKTKKFLGVTYSDSTSTQFGSADAVLAAQFSTLFRGLGSALEQASKPLGEDLDAVKAKLQAHVIGLGKIDLKDLTGEQIQEKLTAVFGAAADRMAGAVLPGLDRFQKVGEGYFETVIRVASGVETARASLGQLGISMVDLQQLARSQGDVGTELMRASLMSWEEGHVGLVTGVGKIIGAFDGSVGELAQLWKHLADMRDGLRAIGVDIAALSAEMVQGAGGSDRLQSGLSTYFERYLTQGERVAEMTRRMAGQFELAGVKLPTSIDAYKQLIKGIDVSGTAGQALFGQLIGLAGGFADLQDAVGELGKETAAVKDPLADERKRLQERIAGMELTGQTEALRQRELAAMDASLRPLQQRIHQLEDEQNAAQVAAQAEKALQSQRLQLEERLLQAQGNTVELRRRELEKLDPANRALQERIWGIEKEKAVAEEAARVAQQAGQLEQQLLQAMGNTAELRRRELEKLDPANRALQERIWVIEKEKAAAEAAARVAEQAGQLEEQLLQAMGNTTELRRRELERLDPSNRALQERIWAIEKEKAVAEEAARVAQQAGQLEEQLLQAQGNTAELRRRELERLDPSNRLLQERIWAIEAEKKAADEAAQAAQQLSQAWKGITDNLLDEVNRIRGLAGGGVDGYAAAQAQFALSSAAARAGDQAAAQALPGLAKTLLEFGEQQARSLAELAGLRASTAASLEETAALLAGRVQTPAPSVAAQMAGTPQVQPLVVQAMQAAVAPAGASSQSMAELLAELRSLRTAGDENARSLSGFSQRAVRVMEKWDVDGVPQQRV